MTMSNFTGHWVTVAMCNSNVLFFAFFVFPSTHTHATSVTTCITYFTNFHARLFVFCGDTLLEKDFTFEQYKYFIHNHG
jgi:phosphoribosyl 1,2-cyclic phosphodiesterase